MRQGLVGQESPRASGSTQATSWEEVVGGEEMAVDVDDWQSQRSSKG